MPTSTAHSRPLNPWLCLGLPLLMMALLLVLPTTSIDFAITQYFYTPGVGFAGKHSYLLENILHERAKQAVILLGLLALAVLELKRSTVSVAEGIRQNLDNQKKEFIQPFFSTLQWLMAGNDSEGLRYATIETPEKYWLQYGGRQQESNLPGSG